MTKDPQHARLYLTDYKIIFNLTPSERAVWLALAYFARASFEADAIIRKSWPSQDRLAELMGCSLGTVCRGIARLKCRRPDGSLIEDHHPQPAAHNRLLHVKRRAGNSAVYILTTQLQPAYLDLSHDEIINLAHAAIPNCSPAERSNHAHAERSNHSPAESPDLSPDERQTAKRTKNLTEKGSRAEALDLDDPRLIRFRDIYSYFSEHPLTSWSATDAENEFLLIADRSKLNVAMELLHIGAYQLQMIDEFQDKASDVNAKRKFWTRSFWIAGMSQWLGRRHKSTLDMKRSAYIEKLKRLIDENKEEAPLHEEAPEAVEVPAPEEVSSEMREEDKWIKDLCDDAVTSPIHASTLRQFLSSGEFPTALKDYAEKCLKEAEELAGGKV